MAAHALRIAMFAEQRIFSFLVVIKDGFFPLDVVVTGLALGTEFSFVPFFLVVVLLVTGKAIHLELVLVDITFVAFDAFDIGMLPV